MRGKTGVGSRTGGGGAGHSFRLRLRTRREVHEPACEIEDAAPEDENADESRLWEQGGRGINGDRGRKEQIKRKGWIRLAGRDTAAQAHCALRGRAKREGARAAHRRVDVSGVGEPPGLDARVERFEDVGP